MGELPDISEERWREARPVYPYDVVEALKARKKENTEEEFLSVLRELERFDYGIRHEMREATRGPIGPVFGFLLPKNAEEFKEALREGRGEKIKLIYPSDNEPLSPKDPELTRGLVKERALAQIPKLEALLSKVEELCPLSEMVPLYQAKINRWILTRKLRLAVGENTEFTKISEQLYPRPEKEVVLKAQRRLEGFREACSKLGKPEVGEVPAELLRAKLEARMQELEISGWEFVFREDLGSRMGFFRRRYQGIQEVRIRRNKKGMVGIPPTEVEAIVDHELVHEIEEENGDEQPLLTLGDGTPASLMDREGKAEYLARKRLPEGVLTGRSITPELRVLVNDWAYSLSNQEIYDRLRHFGISHQLAAETILRAKRGTEGSPGACFTKDGIYYQGILRVEKFVREKMAKGLSEQEAINMLLSGRFSLDDLPWLEKIPGFSLKPKITLKIS